MKNFRYLAFFFVVVQLQSPAFAAEIVQKRSKKKVVVINEGEDKAVKKHSKYCFKDYAGDEVACGKVVKVLKDKSYIFISNKAKFEKIKKTDKVEFDDGSLNNLPTPAFAIALLYSGGLAPSSYNRLSYIAHTQNETNIESLWEGEKVSNVAVKTVGVEISTWWNVSLGFKFRAPSQTIVDTSYLKGDFEQYVHNQTDESSFGLFSDYYIFNNLKGKSGLTLGAGLDLDFSNLAMSYINKSDDTTFAEKDIYTVSSKLTVVSLRIPASYNLCFGMFGVKLGGTLLVPVFETSSQSFSQEDPQTSGYGDADKNVAAETDFFSTLGHKKTSFGFESAIGIYMEF